MRKKSKIKLPHRSGKRSQLIDSNIETKSDETKKFNLVFDYYMSDCCEMHLINDKAIFKKFIKILKDVANCTGKEYVQLKYNKEMRNKIKLPNNGEFKKFYEVMPLGTQLLHWKLNDKYRILFFDINKTYCVLTISGTVGH